MKSFRPPAEWPNAKTEKALDRSYERLADLVDKVDHTYPRDENAAAQKRVALTMLRNAKALLAESYHAEMNARLDLWRANGYEL